MTPLDYSEKKYSVYFEVFPTAKDDTKEIINNLIGNDRFIAQKKIWFGVQNGSSGYT